MKGILDIELEQQQQLQTKVLTPKKKLEIDLDQHDSPNKAVAITPKKRLEMDIDQDVISKTPIAQNDGVPTCKRLMISHIENVDFKSYAGTKILGPFHKNFSAIVGPNGSGKSNVIDAMLFVFGYRSKKIRSKKVSLLIHNSEKHQNVESCTVTVHFQKILDFPGEKYEIIPNSNFKVSRTARRDGSSDYYLDGKKKTFKDIGAVLRESGIDLDHNRFLILQGEVEQISMMKPKAESEHDEGMLEYLEDIVGTNRFKEPIEVASKEVEELNDKRGEKLNRAKAVEKEKDELEDAKNAATEYLLTENKITKKNHILYQKYIYNCTENENKSTEKKNEVKKSLEELEEKLKVLIDQKKEKGKEYKKVNKLFDKLVEEDEENKKKFAEFEILDLKIREDLKHAKQSRKKLAKNLETEKKKLEDLTAAPKENKDEIERLTKSYDDLQNKKKSEEEKLNEIMAGLKHETQGMQQEKEVKEAELLEKQKDVNETKSKLEVASSELEIYVSRYKKLQEQFDQAQQNRDTAKNSREDKKNKISEMEEDKVNAKKEIEETTKILDQVTKQEEELSAKVRTLRKKVEESRSAMAASRSRGVVLEALMKQKEKGHLKGIHGRLGDLGSIDKKYDVAISTACGPLDFVVCDTMDTAQKGVEFLKKNNIGSTTFIALDKVETWRKRANSKIKTPENVPRLFDLVQNVKEEIKTAFYFALKDTLVSETLEQATKIAFPKDPKASRWRVVTLKGELIETSGTMSGGGNKPVCGRMGQNVSKEVSQKDIDKCQNELDGEVDMLEMLREKKQEQEQKKEKLSRQAPNIDHQLKKLKMEIESLTVQEKEQKERVESLKQEVQDAKPNPKEEQKKKQAIDQFDKAFKKASQVAGKIEKEVQDLHTKIMDIGKTKLGGQQAKLDSLNKVIDEIVQKKTKATVAIKTAERNLKKCEEKAAAFKKDVEENENKIKNLEEVELKKLEDQAVVVLSKAQEGKDKMNEMQKTLEEVKNAFDSADKEESDLRSKKIDFDHEFQKYETTVKENHSKILHWQSKLKTLSLHVVRSSSKSTDESSSQDTLVCLTDEELKSVDEKAMAYEITVLSERLTENSPNMAAIAEYFKKEELYLSRVKELEEVTQQRDETRKKHDDLRNERLQEFMTGFRIITSKLKEMYQMITLGGDAELELVDSLDPFAEGISFSVRPPKKSWKNIANLSGGEKTLSSLALVFALHHYKPSPLYVMDEIDAALDFKNVSIIANYIKERTKNAQFIIISLRSNMFELADRFVGIYKTDNCTKSVCINPFGI